MTFSFPSAGFDEAVAAICHGTASEEQLRGVNGVLRHNPAARDEYLVRVELHSRLASEPDLFAPASGDVLAWPAPDTRRAPIARGPSDVLLGMERRPPRRGNDRWRCLGPETDPITH